MADEVATIEERDEPRITLLDRGIDLPLTAGRTILLTLALAVAALTRLLGLDRFPLSIGEANIALSATRLLHGDDTASNLYGQPFAVDWTGLFFFGGGTSDTVGRIAMAAVGIAVVGLLLKYLGWGGRRLATAGVVLAALSPTLIAASRRIDGGILLVALSLIISVLAYRSREADGLGWPAAAGVATGLLLVTHPLGIPAAILTWGAILLGGAKPNGFRPHGILAGLIGAIAAIGLSTTVLLTRPGSFSASIGAILSDLWHNHLTEIGQGWHLPIFNLVLNEPLLIVFAIIGLALSQHRRLALQFATWFGVNLLVFSVLGNSGVPGYALTTFALVPLAALGAVEVYERVDWHSLRQGRGTLFVFAVGLMVLALVSLLGLVTSGVTGSTGEWLLRFALVVLVGVLPLSFAITATGSSLAGKRVGLVLLLVVVFFGLLTIRSAVLAASERSILGDDPLSVGATNEGVLQLVERLDKISRDMTLDRRSSIDPAGGKGLRIAIDERHSQPFAWYFRDYPNVALFDPTQRGVPQDAELAFVGSDVDPASIGPTMTSTLFDWQVTPSPTLTDPNWTDVLTGLVRPNKLRHFVDILISREARPAHDVQAYLLAAPAIADRFMPNTGPFSLFDRPGPGNGDGQMRNPRGIAVAPDGRVYVVDSGNARINVYDQSGQYMFAFGSEGSGPSQFARMTAAGGAGPNGIAIDDSGNIFVADTWNHRIQVFNLEGQYLREWGQFYDTQDNPDMAQEGLGNFFGPRGVAFFNGELYVTDTGNERVQVFTPDGTVVRAFGSLGAGDGELSEPVGIAITADGTILVADTNNGRIARFSSDATPLEPWLVNTWTGLTFFEPYLLVGEDGRVYASTSSASAIVVLDAEGAALTSIGLGMLVQPYGMAFDPSGTTLLVTDGAINSAVTIPIPAP